MRAKFPIQLAKELIILSAYSEAIELLRPEAERGQTEAQFLYGFLHFLNPDLSSSDAIQMIQNAAQQGHADACYVITVVPDLKAPYQFQAPRSEDDWNQIRWAARHKSVAARIELAKGYIKGQFVPKNRSYALRILKKSLPVRPLHYEARYHLIKLLFELKGREREKDISWAFTLLANPSLPDHGIDDPYILKFRDLFRAKIHNSSLSDQKKEGYIRNFQREFQRVPRRPMRPAWQRYLHYYCCNTLSYDPNKATFEDFMAILFEHPLTTGEDRGKKWTSFASFRFPENTVRTLFRYYMRLFRDPAFLLERYTPQQIDQGLWMHPCSIGSILHHKDISSQDVEACLEAMYDLFATLFAQPAMLERWQSAAYMWWDSNFCNFYVYQEPTTKYARDREAKSMGRRDDQATVQRFREINLNVMRRVLQLEPIACKRAALHGLGHLDHPGKEQVIRDFLAANPDLPDFENWYKYGMAAIEGKVM